MLQLNAYAKAALKCSKDHGFEEDPVSVDYLMKKLMLIVTEVAEAAEDVRKDNRAHFGEELADICIRVFALAARMEIDLEEEILRKHAKNVDRPLLHGGKLA